MENLQTRGYSRWTKLRNILAPGATLMFNIAYKVLILSYCQVIPYNKATIIIVRKLLLSQVFLFIEIETENY